MKLKTAVFTFKGLRVSSKGLFMTVDKKLLMKPYPALD